MSDVPGTFARPEERIGFAEAIRLVFRTAASNARLCFGIAAFYAIPWGIANAVSRSSTRFLDPRTLSSQQAAAAGLTAVLAGAAMLVIAVFIGSITIGALSLVGSAAVYGDVIDKRGLVRRTIDRALDAVAANVLAAITVSAALVGLGLVAYVVRVLFSSSLAFSVLMFGLVALAPVLLYLAVHLSLTTPVVMREQRGPIDALRRSWQLTRGAWWWIFGIGLVLTLPLVALQQASEWVIGRGGPIDFLLWAAASFVVAELTMVLYGLAAGVIYATRAPEDVVPPDVQRLEQRSEVDR